MNGDIAPGQAVNPVATAGFGSQADAYQRGRPNYSDDAVDWMLAGVAPGARVLDLAAGTGKLTTQLLSRGYEVVAVEPVDEMRSELAAAAPDATVLAGAAESIPLPDCSVDAILIAQAFHWFDERAAMVEITRVVRRRGRLALIWNERDNSVPWMARLTNILHSNITLPYDRDRDWSAIIDKPGTFTRVEHHRGTFHHMIDTETLLARVASTSYIGAMSAEERAPFLERTRSLVAGFPEPFAMPYVSDAFRCNRR
jgi:SAM-dependent methyltransferase